MDWLWRSGRCDRELTRLLGGEGSRLQQGPTRLLRHSPTVSNICTTLLLRDVRLDHPPPAPFAQKPHQRAIPDPDVRVERRFGGMKDAHIGRDVDQTAVRAAEQVLDSSWEQLSAFYDVAAVRSLLGREGKPVTRQAVIKRKDLLALTTGNGQVVYPAFQFHGRQLVDGLDQVLNELPEQLVSRWTLASWLVTPEPDLGGERPIDSLFDEDPGGVDEVVRVAQAWAVQLAR